MSLLVPIFSLREMGMESFGFLVFTWTLSKDVYYITIYNIYIFWYIFRFWVLVFVSKCPATQYYRYFNALTSMTVMLGLIGQFRCVHRITKSTTVWWWLMKKLHLTMQNFVWQHKQFEKVALEYWSISLI